METMGEKQTKWEGLWWNPKYNGFSSSAISLAELRKFKGKVRLYVRKNKFYNNGENGRPNYHFCFKDVDSETFHILEIEDECVLKDRYGKRLYTEREVRDIINGTASDIRYGLDEYDILPKDFVHPFKTQY